MTALRQRLIDDFHLRGYAERTVETFTAKWPPSKRTLKLPKDLMIWLPVRDKLSVRLLCTLARALGDSPRITAYAAGNRKEPS